MQERILLYTSGTVTLLFRDKPIYMYVVVKKLEKKNMLLAIKCTIMYNSLILLLFF